MKVRTPRDLGLVVRGRRKDLGWSQAKLAERSGVSRWWISEFETGRARAELELVLRTLAALDLAVDVTRRDVVATPKPVAAGTSVPRQSPVATRADLDHVLDDVRTANWDD